MEQFSGESEQRGEGVKRLRDFLLEQRNKLLEENQKEGYPPPSKPFIELLKGL